MDLFGAYDSWSIDLSDFVARDLGGPLISRPICGSGRRHWNGQHARKHQVFVYTLLLSMGDLMAMSKGSACAHDDNDVFTLPSFGHKMRLFYATRIRTTNTHSKALHTATVECVVFGVYWSAV